MTISSNQKAFNKIYKHLLKQGAKSQRKRVPGISGTSVECAYRGAEGRRCAVGVLIANEHYRAEMEGKSVVDRDVCDAVEKSGYTKLCWDLMKSLQMTHDSHPVKEWRKRLHEIAETYDLAIPVLK